MPIVCALLATALAAEPAVADLPAPVASDALTTAVHDAFVAQRRAEIAGMTTLVAWSGASAVTGAALWGAGPDRQTRMYGAATLGWSAINLGIGIPGLVGALRDTSPPSTLGEWRKEESQLRGAFAFNAGLDVGWVLLGGLLWDHGVRIGDDRLVGSGQAIVTQGGFLLVFDSAMTGVTGGQSRRFWASPALGPVMGVQLGGAL